MDLKQYRDITPEVKFKALHIIDYFDKSRSHAIAHLLLTLEMMYNFGRPQEEIKLYQDVLYYVSKVWEGGSGI